LVIGDIHGAFLALKQCLGRSKFQPKTDLLICLGDVVDGWPQTRECIDFLLELPHLVYIKGNHDDMALLWSMTGEAPYGWKAQGGYATIDSYNRQMLDTHVNFLKNGHLYHLESNKLFVHAGINPSKKIEDQGSDIFLWDRSLFKEAFTYRLEENPPQLSDYDEIYIGHTPIHNYGYNHPIKACEVWMMDTGAGWNGVLSIMDINTKEYWMSDSVDSLYPDHKGRFADIDDFNA